MPRAARWGLLGLAVVVVFAGIGLLVDRGVDLIPSREGCTATVQGRKVTLDVEQAENAALIAAVSVRRGMPARAATIALATAYQESKLRNIEHGDRDSLGLFQQRPSQGWGSREQILDPYYSINAFYDGLDRIDDYGTMRVTEAAQAVQRSGFPEAYADHEGDARVLASALTGNSRGAFHCEVDAADDAASDRLGDAGLTRRAARVLRDLEAAFGDQSVGGFQPGGVSTGHMEGSAHYEGRAVDVFVRPIGPDNRKRGWAMAAYLTAQASRLGIDTVIFDDRIWHAGSRSDDGWTNYRVPSSSRGDRAILEHRDHVHVDVHD